jgi:hypothetical protein
MKKELDYRSAFRHGSLQLMTALDGEADRLAGDRLGVPFLPRCNLQFSLVRQ